MKRVLLMVALAVAFLGGYAAAVKAWPGVDDRDPYHGFFTNTDDDQGTFVLSGGIPSYINSPNEFINYIVAQLQSGNAQNRVGANFIVDFMLGGPTWRRDRWGTSQFNNVDLPLWESEVRAAAGRTSWFQNFTFTGNSYYQGTSSGPNPVDDAFYYENDTQQSIIFRNANGTIATVIKRACGNIVTNGYSPGLKADYTVTGRTTVSNASPAPGDTITFSHFLKNNGPTGAPTEYYNPSDGPSGSPTGLSNASAGPIYFNPGQEKNVRNETFTIPAAAAPNTKYCRRVGWFPVNEGGGNGTGAEACATVVVPAKLKATMVPNPSTAVPGDTVTFQPGVNTQSSGNPVTVNCTIVRTVQPPSGPPTSLGNQPCVDSTGNPNIVVPTGGSVALRPNTYTISDTTPVGAKVCDTITITVPVSPAYFNTPADRTATGCVTVGKTPYVYFMGNDVFAGGGFAAVDPTCSSNAKITTVGRTLGSGAPAGSVGEYSAFALDKISGFGSAGKVLIGTGAVGGANRQLTFANSEGDPTKLGYFGQASHCIDDYAAQFASAPVVGGFGSNNVASHGNGAWHVTGSITLDGVMPNGIEQAYLVDGDVTIDGDLRYTGTYNGINDIPSLVIIARGNIFVGSGVHQIDGVLVAQGNGTTSGVLYTCWPKVEPASITNPCNANQLVVNGAVAVGGLDLFRSAGATGATDALRQQPAEIFNFNPEVYLRNILGNSGQSSVRTSNVLDLPPRF